MNISHASNRALLEMITGTGEQCLEGQRHNEEMTPGDNLSLRLRGMFNRQRAINVLRGRMKFHYDAEVMGELRAKSPGFAQVFVEKHLRLGGKGITLFQAPLEFAH